MRLHWTGPRAVVALILFILFVGPTHSGYAAGTGVAPDVQSEAHGSPGSDEDFAHSWPTLHWVGFASLELGLRTVQGDVHVPGIAEGAGRSGLSGPYVGWQAAGYGRSSFGHRPVMSSTMNSRTGPLGDSQTAQIGCCNIVAAFDSRGKEQRERLESDGYTGYPMLGDSSAASTDAVSRHPVYLLIERGPTYLIYGDYHTGLTDGQLLVHDRRLTGLKVHDATETDAGRIALTVTAAVSKQSTFTDRLPSAGVAGFYRLTHGNVVPNSERVTIVVADSEGAVDGTVARPLRRDLDYIIDYVEGTLLFKQSVPMVDAHGNVYHIVVRYEYEADVAAVTTVTGRLAHEGATSRLGLTAVAEDSGQPGTNTERNALGIDGAVRLATWLQAEAEWATSHVNENGNAIKGNAYLLQLSGDLRPDLRYRLNHRRQAPTFEPMHSPGAKGQALERTNARLIYSLPMNPPSTNLSVTLGRDVERTSSTTTGNTGLDSGRSSLGVTYGIDQWTLRGNVETGIFAQTGAGTDRWTRTAYGLGAAYRFAAGHSAGMFRDGSTSASSVTGKQEVHGATGLNYNHRLDERTDWTAGYMTSDVGRQSLWTGVAHQLVDTDAVTTNVYTRYQIDGTIDEHRAGTAFGLNNRWHLTREVAVDFGYERTEAIATTSPSTSGSLPGDPPGTPPGTPPPPATVQEAWNASFSFVPDLPYRFSMRYSTNTSAGDTRQLIQLNVLGNVSDDVSLSAALTWSTPPAAPGQTAVGARQQQSLGVAYRPMHTSRFNALGFWERDVSTRPSVGSKVNANEVQTVSAEASYWVTTALELAAKVAQRRVVAEVNPAPAVRTSTNLYQMRGTVALTPRWDTTLVYRRLQQQATEQQPRPLWQTGWQGSVGFRLLEADPRWKVEAGYRYADYAPEDDPSADAFVAGPFVRLTYRF